MKCLFLWLFFLLFLPPVMAQWGQQPVLCHYTVRDGLPSNVVYDVMQDSRGFIWISTDQGVSRFDGTGFRNFTSEDGLPDNEIFRALEDDEHRIWLVCYNSRACCIDGDKVYNSTNSLLCRRLETEGVRYSSLERGPDGAQYMAGTHIVKLKGNDFRYRLFNICQSGPGDLVYKSWRNKEYIGSHGFFGVLTAPQVQDLWWSPYWRAIQDKDNFFGFSTMGGNSLRLQHWKLTDSGAKLYRSVSVKAWIHNMSVTPEGNVLCSTEKGLMLYHPATGMLEPDSTVPPGIIPNCVFTDREGNKWFSTINDGVYMKLKNAPALIGKQAGLPRSNILSISKTAQDELVTGDDDGGLGLVTSGGIRTFNIKNNGQANRVLFARVRNDGVIISGTDLALMSSDIRTGVSKVIFKGAIKSGVLRKDYCLVGFAGGVYKYFSPKGKDTMYLWNERAMAVEETPDGKVWIGTLAGLYWYDEGGHVLYSGHSQLSRTRVTGLAVTADGKVAVGTNTCGVFIIPGYDKPPVHIDQQHGLSSNSCKKVYADEEGNIWVITASGLDRLDPVAGGGYRVYPYSLPEGATGSRINDMVIAKGKLCLATADGVLIVDRSSQGYGVPLLYLQSVNDSILIPGAQVGKLVLPYNKNELRVIYSGVSFTGGPNLQYKYFLEGSNGDTVFTRDRTINFSALRPGNYELMVWARNKLGHWTPSPVTLSFRVRPPLWLNPWVLLASVLVLSLGGYIGYRSRIKTIQLQTRKTEQHKRQMAELEMKALRAQINPHFIFNALNSIQTYYSQHDELTANHYMTSFAQFIRKTLNQSQVHWLPLAEESEMLHTYIELEQMRFKKLFTFDIYIDPAIDREQTEVPAMLIQPYVENAINHGLRNLKGRPGLLSVRFTLLEEQLQCIIDDNGIGRAEAQRFRTLSHSSLGMHITRQRVESINQLYHTTIAIAIKDKWIAPGQPGGTTIEMLIPLQKKHKYADHYSS